MVKLLILFRIVILRMTEGSSKLSKCKAPGSHQPNYESHQNQESKHRYHRAKGIWQRPRL